MIDPSATHWDRHPEFDGVSRDRLIDPQGRARPLYLKIETVNLCNNDCIICAYGDQSRARRFMASAIFERALDQYQDMGGGYVSLTPLVGDPLMDRHLLQRIRYLRACPFVSGIGFTTNGAVAHRFDDDTLAEIIGALQRLSISIYGLDAEEHRAMTRRDGGYTRMTDGIRRIVEAAAVPVSLEFRLLNERPAGFIEDWLADIGIDANDGRVAINSVAMQFANWGLYDERDRPLPGQASWFDFKPAAKRPQCLIPMFAVIVFSNGNVSFCPCDNFDDTEPLRLGNVMSDTISNMFNSERARHLWDWQGCGVPAFCQACSFHIPLSTLAEQPNLVDDPHRLVGAG